MKHTNRLVRHFVSLSLQGARVTLDARSANYLTTTLRLGTGAQVVLFDGAGTERWATITGSSRGKVELELGEAIPVQPPSPLSIHLIQALPKGDAMDMAVQKATELGVARILPVTTEFGVVKLPAERRQRRLVHWQHIARSACEQCGRHFPPQIEPPLSLQECLAGLTTTGLRLVLDPGAVRPLARVAANGHDEMTLLVGPEGGLSDGDLELAVNHGFESYSLGPRILRTETAAMAACTVLQCRGGDLGVR